MNKIANTTYLNNIDEVKSNQLLDEVDINSKYFVDITNKVVTEYTQNLDTIMQSIYSKINASEGYECTELEKDCLKLSNLLYFMGDRLENIGIKADLSDAARKEVYNKAYLNNQVKDVEKKNKTTVAECQAVAEEASKYETVVNSIYERAYKIIKYKIDAANKLIDVIRKVITKRMNDDTVNYQLSRVSNSSY